ncbi:MAG: DUF1579 domain-containing protein [Fimbriiglobus sp.]|nr:DUF1579 domain-containing protein [Fimbriiglobus sp.]
MKVEPQAEHRWLEQLAGEWEWEMVAPAGPDQPPSQHTGTESAHMLNVWALCHGTYAMPDGGTARTLMTLGFDPTKGKFVGTFVGSMMTHLWVYEGELDPAGKVLTLNADGPNFADPIKTAKYQDVIEVVSPDHRTLTSRFQGEDGQWVQFMHADYRRKG